MFSLVSIIFLKLFKHSNSKFPPSPPKLPIIGNLLQLGDLPHQSLWRLSKKYGPVMQLKLGTVPTVVVSSSEEARQTLKVHDIHCCTRPHVEGARILSYNFSNVGFCPFDDYWKDVRKLFIKEFLSAKKVNSILPIIEEEVKILTDSIASQKDYPVNFNKKLLTLTASVICKAAFGVSFQGTVLNNDRFNTLIREALASLGSFSASDFYPYVGWIIDWFTGSQRRIKRSTRALDAFYEQMIDLHREGKKQGSEDFLDVLLRMEKEEAVLGNEKFTRNHVKGILLDVVLAGIDTSAITMTWAMAEFMRNPRVMKNVQAEIRTHMGKRERISFEDTEQFHYLKMVKKEIWRLHPPTPLLIPREVMSEFEINGYKIQPNSRVLVNVWAIGRDPKIWKNPEEFLPERFMDSNIEPRGQNFELLPFGAGRRVCPGIYMASSMVEFGLANLLFHFDWKLPEGMTVKDIDMEEAPGLTVSKKNELLLVPVKNLNH